MARYVPGKTYRPDIGEHAGHLVRILSNDTRRVTLPGFPPVRHVLVRCEDDLHSWTFGDDSASDRWD